MHVDADDVRPPTLLVGARLNVSSFLGGVAMAMVAHLGVPAILVAIAAAFTALGILTQGEKNLPPIVERQIVEARFVQLGKPLDPRKLPHRRVPQLSTALPDETVVSKNPREAVERPDAGTPPPNATPDFLQRLGDRAQMFAEMNAPEEREGSPEGIEEGTETEARAGDLYAGKLNLFFRRGWSLPSLVSDEERAQLLAEVDIEIGTDLKIQGATIRRPSGNALFDQSVLDRIQQIRDSGTPLPEPPPEVAQDYVGRTIGLRFQGKDAGR